MILHNRIVGIKKKADTTTWVKKKTIGGITPKQREKLKGQVARNKL